jgi:peptide chain release factor 2
LWNDKDNAISILNNYNYLKEQVTSFSKLNEKYNDYLNLISNLDPEDLDFFELIDGELQGFQSEVKDFEREILFSGEYDGLDATLEIHPGAGGTESHDWASMLLRMYIRFCEQHKFTYKIIDFLEGEEAGLKSVTLQIKGRNVYGMLKAEKGVHRLVRISPFDSNARRHTSFASVGVTPIFTNNIDIVINEKDLRIDTYRSQGAGGQNVNRTDSAVRITHIPTQIVTSCQVERSQIQNREIAMNMLKARLYERELKLKEEKLKNIIGEQKNIEWGSQIRSYVFCPYTLVKDHRTGYEEGNVSSVMDGEIDNFIYSYLEMEVKQNQK